MDMSQPGGHDSMREKLARRWDVMAADNESTTRGRRSGGVSTS